MKAIFILAILSLTTACSTVNDLNQKSAEASTGASMIENSTYNIDRAIATGERVKEKVQERFKRKK